MYRLNGVTAMPKRSGTEKRCSFEASAPAITRWTHWSVIVWQTEALRYGTGKPGVYRLDHGITRKECVSEGPNNDMIMTAIERSFPLPLNDYLGIVGSEAIFVYPDHVLWQQGVQRRSHIDWRGIGTIHSTRKAARYCNAQRSPTEPCGGGMKVNFWRKILRHRHSLRFLVAHHFDKGSLTAHTKSRPRQLPLAHIIYF